MSSGILTCVAPQAGSLRTASTAFTYVAAVAGVPFVAANLLAQASAFEATVAPPEPGTQMARGDDQSEFIVLPAYTILMLDETQDEVGLTDRQKSWSARNRQTRRSGKQRNCGSTAGDRGRAASASTSM